jgi:hypothetical protein
MAGAKSAAAKLFCTRRVAAGHGEAVELRPEPWFLLSASTVKVGDLGRTELALSAEEGARMLFETVQELKAPPDHVESCWAHSQVRYADVRSAVNRCRPIGFERRFNRAFQTAERGEFVACMLNEIVAPPAKAEENRAVNLGRMTEQVGTHSHGR